MVRQNESTWSDRMRAQKVIVRQNESTWLDRMRAHGQTEWEHNVMVRRQLLVCLRRTSNIIIPPVRMVKGNFASKQPQTLFQHNINLIEIWRDRQRWKSAEDEFSLAAAARCCSHSPLDSTPAPHPLSIPYSHYTLKTLLWNKNQLKYHKNQQLLVF